MLNLQEVAILNRVRSLEGVSIPPAYVANWAVKDLADPRFDHMVALQAFHNLKALGMIRQRRSGGFELTAEGLEELTKARQTIQTLIYAIRL